MKTTAFLLLYQLSLLMGKLYLEIDSGELAMNDNLILESQDDKIVVKNELNSIIHEVH